MIGIVGGVGPLAGVDLATQLIAETKVTADQEHLPFMLVSMPQEVPDRTRYLLGEEPVNPAFALSNLLRKLEGAGASVAAIACNTAHAPAIFDEINRQLQASGSRLDVIHLIQTTVAFLCRWCADSKIGLLGSLGTWTFGLYRQPLQEAGLEVIDLPEAAAKRVHEAIYNKDYGIKVYSKPVSGRARRELQAEADRLVDAGATSIVLGCTELPLTFGEEHYRGARLVDPARLLARELIARVAPEKLASRRPY